MNAPPPIALQRESVVAAIADYLLQRDVRLFEFAQQAANLWAVKQRLHQQLLIELGAATDPIRLVNGRPLPVYGLTRALRCRWFPEAADWSYCAEKLNEGSKKARRPAEYRA